MTLWFTFNDQQHLELTNKIDSNYLSNLIIGEWDKLKEYEEQESDLGQFEKEILLQNSDIDDRLIFVLLLKVLAFCWLVWKCLF